MKNSGVIYEKIKSEIDILIKTENITKKDTLFFFIMLRKYLESCNLKSEYYWIKFYTDWLVHSFIDKINPKVKEVFDQLIKYKSTRNNCGYEVISKLNKFHHLQNELQELFKKNFPATDFPEHLMFQLTSRLPELLDIVYVYYETKEDDLEITFVNDSFSWNLKKSKTGGSFRSQRS